MSVSTSGANNRGLNESLYTGEVHWLDALGDGWIVQLDGIRVGNQSIDISSLPQGNLSLPGGARPIELDFTASVTTAILSAPVVDAIYTAANASGKVSSNCQAPEITFTLGGRDFTVTGADVLRYRSQNPEAPPVNTPCVGAIARDRDNST